MKNTPKYALLSTLLLTSFYASAEEVVDETQTVIETPEVSVDVEQVQEAQTDNDNNSAEEAQLLNKVIVKGQKIDRSRQDTVESVKVFTAEDLDEKAKANDFYDLLDQTANVTKEGGFAYQIRGISVNGPSNAEAGAKSIAFIIDDVVQGMRGTQEGALSMWDVEQVEVLRGAQSTTSGRNSLAGAFIFKTKDPEFEHSGHAKIGYGNYNTYQAAIAQTGPLSDKLAYRLSIDHNHSDNYSKNTFFNKENWDQQTSTNVRAKFKYVTDSNSDFLLSINGVKFNDHGDDNVVGKENTDDYKLRESKDNYDSQWITNTKNVSLKYNKQLSSGWAFSYARGYGSVDYQRNSDLDGGFDTGEFYVDSKSEDASEELLFKYNGNKAKAVVGLYASSGSLDDKITSKDFAFNLQGRPGIPPSIKYAFINFKTSTEESFRNAALFYNADIKFSKKFTYISGLRLDYEEREQSIVADGGLSRSTGVTAVDDALRPSFAALGGRSEGKSNSFNVLPKQGFDYAWTDTLNTGLIIQRGYRPGGVSVNAVKGTAKKYEAEFTTNYELSLRKTNKNKTFNFNTNLFYVDWENQQIRVQQGASPYDVFVENASSSHIYGLEFDTTIKATDALSLGLQAGYSKTEFDEFKPRGRDFSGNEFRFARKWTAGVNAAYFHDSGFFFNTQLNHSSDAWVNQANTVKLDGFKLWNIKTGYEQDAWRTSIYVNNILDELYRNEQYPTALPGHTEYVLGAPRTFGANVELFW